MKTETNFLEGKESKVIISFAIPMIIGNIFQQLYNVADTIIVGKFIGPEALAAVGSAFSVMVLLTSIIFGQFRFKRRHLHFNKKILKMITNNSVLSSIQQSIMNFGILLIQGLVNSFGVSVMAAFTAVVKIESFAYMPVQDFGNAFSIFVAQNKGAGQLKRIHKGIRSALKIITIYCLIITSFILIFAKPLLYIFINKDKIEILNIGTQYLYIVAVFYCLIGYLFMFYGLFRGYGRPEVSIILTIASLGTRVALAYTLSAIPWIGILGIWWSIPIGWAIADIIGLIMVKFLLKKP
ncbi:MAG: MATE family efflux transporter [Bacillota bacterium]|nr:MATE family efflux transporter [Bacillota bacterium]